MIPKPTWPKAPERGSSAALKAEYLSTKKRARQAIDDLNAGRSITNEPDEPLTIGEKLMGVAAIAVALAALVILTIGLVTVVDWMTS